MRTLQLRLEGEGALRPPPRAYTRWLRARAVAGCAVKMLLGHDCYADVPLDQPMLARAISRAEHDFAFVGLTDEWALSPRAVLAKTACRTLSQPPCLPEGHPS